MASSVNGVRRALSRRLASVLALTVVLAAVAVGVPASPAFAATCYGNGCNRLDPQSTGCAGANAQTLDDALSTVDGYALIELRYSPVCNAAWARVTFDLGGCPPHKSLRLQAWNQGGTGGTLITTVNKELPECVAEGSQYWTGMYTFSVWVQACLKYRWNDVGPCTDRH